MNQPLNPQNKKTRENSALPPQIPFTFPIGDAVDKNVVKTVNDLIYLLSMCEFFYGCFMIFS